MAMTSDERIEIAARLRKLEKADEPATSWHMGGGDAAPILCRLFLRRLRNVRRA